MTFSEDVDHVTSGDFTATAPGGGTATTAPVTLVLPRNAADDDSVHPPAGVFRITLAGNNLESYEGAVGLDFRPTQDIADAAGNALDATLPTNADYETYTLDNSARRSPPSSATTAPATTPARSPTRTRWRSW